MHICKHSLMPFRKDSSMLKQVNWCPKEFPSIIRVGMVELYKSTRRKFLQCASIIFIMWTFMNPLGLYARKFLPHLLKTHVTFSYFNEVFPASCLYPLSNNMEDVVTSRYKNHDYFQTFFDVFSKSKLIFDWKKLQIEKNPLTVFKI